MPATEPTKESPDFLTVVDVLRGFVASDDEDDTRAASRLYETTIHRAREVLAALDAPTNIQQWNPVSFHQGPFVQ
jgi:hypothetical protein